MADVTDVYNCFIQAYGYSGVSDYFEIPALGPQSKVLLRISSIVILIAGSYVLAWLWLSTLEKALVDHQSSLFRI